MGNPGFAGAGAHHRQTGARPRASLSAPIAIRPRRASPASAGRWPAITTERFGVKLNPDTADRRDAGFEGRFRQSRASDHGAGRHGDHARRTPSYPIHALRLHHGGRRDPSRAEAHSPEQYLSGIEPRGAPFGAAADRHGGPQLSRRTRPRSVVDLDFYKDAIALAKKNEMFVLSDMAYSEIYFDGQSAAVGYCKCRGRDGCLRSR